MPADFGILTETDWAYLAGILDGEGCISVFVATGGAYALQVKISQKNKEDLLLLQSKYGGKIYPKNKESAVQLGWLGQTAGQMLRQVFPFLKWKKEEAELAISFTDEVMCGRHGIKQKQDKVLGEFIKKEMSVIKKVRYA